MAVPRSTIASNIRLGLIGCGYVSKYHVAASRALGANVVAACDRKPEAAARVADLLGAKPYTSPEAVIDGGVVDAVIIATPHYAHAPLALDAFRRGLHVLVEKPLTVTAGESAALIAESLKHPELVFAVDFNQRTWPLWRAVKAFIDDGTVGPISRFNWTITDWYRTQHYYNQSSWRGTWSGEGGGVLVNQCPHQLDLLCWFFGLPRRVMASVQFGKHHDIEVEDEVHALLEYDSGTVGSFITSTGETVGQNRLEIIGDRAAIRVTSEDSLELTRLAVPSRTHTMTVAERNALPDQTTQTVRFTDTTDEYTEILRNFLAACAGTERPIAPGVEAIASIELANGILMSGCERRAIELPTDHAAFATLLRGLCERGDAARKGVAS